MRIDAMTPDDWPRVQEIYAAGIATGDATFELEPPEWKAWDDSHLPEHRLVARDEDDSIVGWAALSPSRGVRFIAEWQRSVFTLTGIGADRALAACCLKS